MDWKLIWENEGTWTIRQPSGGDLESNIQEHWTVTYKIYFSKQKNEYRLIMEGVDAKNHTLYIKAMEKLNELKHQI